MAKLRKLSEFGVALDIDTENAEKWMPDETYEVNGVVILNGEFGEYPRFKTVDDKLLIVGGTVVTRTAHQLAEIFQKFPNVSFKLLLQERVSGGGRTYNILTEVVEE